MTTLTFPPINPSRVLSLSNAISVGNASVNVVANSTTINTRDLNVAGNLAVTGTVSSLTAVTLSLNSISTNVVSVNGTAGSSRQVLTSNGTVTYWFNTPTRGRMEQARLGAFT